MKTALPAVASPPGAPKWCPSASSRTGGLGRSGRLSAGLHGGFLFDLLRGGDPEDGADLGREEQRRDGDEGSRRCSGKSGLRRGTDAVRNAQDDERSAHEEQHDLAGCRDREEHGRSYHGVLQGRREATAAGRIVAPMTSDDRLESYARLAVEVGVNLAPGQFLYVSGHPEHLLFARAIARSPTRSARGMSRSLSRRPARATRADRVRVRGVARLVAALDGGRCSTTSHRTGGATSRSAAIPSRS